MIAFWEYLKREYQLSNAENILRYLRAVKPTNFKKWMNDPSRFGMAKSFFSIAQSHGYDLSDEKQNQEFMGMYNAGLLGGGGFLLLPSDIDLPLFGGLHEKEPKSKKERDKARHKRKIARASRKKNRKWK